MRAAQPRLRVFTGPMASGKTVRLIMAAESARKVVSQVVFIKHRVDTRSNAVTSRSGLRVPADFVVDRLCSLDAKADILYAVDEAQVSTVPPSGGALLGCRPSLRGPGCATTAPSKHLSSFLQAVQFYPDLIDFWAKVHSAGAYMAAAGLDRDFARRPFGQVSEINRAAVQ